MTAALNLTAQAVIVGLSCFGAGVAIYLAVGINLRAAIRDRDPWPLAWAINRLCVAVMVLLIAETVFKAPTIPLSWRVIIYIAALVGACVSWIFIGIDHRRRHRRHTDPG
jgi:hypothetical protein